VTIAVMEDFGWPLTTVDAMPPIEGVRKPQQCWELLQWRVEFGVATECCLVAIMGRVLVEMVLFSVAITMGGGVGQRQSWRKQLL
jgi:hypothetical protein